LSVSTYAVIRAEDYTLDVVSTIRVRSLRHLGPHCGGIMGVSYFLCEKWRVEQKTDCLSTACDAGGLVEDVKWQSLAKNGFAEGHRQISPVSNEYPLLQQNHSRGS
jgi:hypothetical protein